jgi:hypothetical protein
MKHKGFDNRNIYNSTIHKQWLIMLSIQSSLNIQAENNLNVTTLFTNSPVCAQSSFSFWNRPGVCTSIHSPVRLLFL